MTTLHLTHLDTDGYPVGPTHSFETVAPLSFAYDDSSSVEPAVAPLTEVTLNLEMTPAPYLIALLVGLPPSMADPASFLSSMTRAEWYLLGWPARYWPSPA